MRVRRGEARDVGTIVEFNEAMARETEGRELDKAVLTSGVEGLMIKPQYGFYLVALEGQERLVGSLLVTYEWSDWRNGLLWWIQSVYVRPDWRRRGVYRRLYQEVKDLAGREPLVRGIRLYVEQDNATARGTYAALGMEQTPYRIFEELF
ncbi:MAG: GNAT family N-acetyltransferase [Candidatus Competibacteraceae bacterium]|nr:GNAT family N-acetyltransferase [Candidatus Competibacteraceae bacterium]